MNYPKMLYHGDAKYTDNEQLRNDLFTKALKTIIVDGPEQEALRREQGYVDLSDLIYRPKPKTIQFSDEDSQKKVLDAIDDQSLIEKPKRKYMRKVPDVSHNPA